MADLSPVFRGTDRERGQSVLAPAVFKVTLIQSNQHARAGYLGAACLGALIVMIRSGVRPWE